jgi:hypothetical protein
MMEISKSLFAATIVSATLITGAVAYAASSGAIDGRDDNVGKLQPTAVQNSVDSRADNPTSTTRIDDSTTRRGSSSTVTTSPSTTRRPDATTATAGTAPTSTIDDHGGDRIDNRDDNSGPGSGGDASDDNSGPGSGGDASDDNSGPGSGSDDRRHGRGSDDD